MLREGIEDYEYFYLLRTLMENLRQQQPDHPLISVAEKLLHIPTSVVKSLTSYTTSPEPIDTHRKKVARAIEQLQSELKTNN